MDNDGFLAGRGPTVSRRSFVLGTLAAAGLSTAVLGSSSLGSRAAEGAVGSSRPQLQFWHLLTGGDGGNMNTIINRINKVDKSATVKQTILAWGSPYYTKLAMAAAGGKPPDLAISHLSRIEGLTPGGLFDEWDMSRFAKYGITEEDFTKPTFKRMHVGDKLYAIALDTHAMVRFFNPEIAEKAGVLGADGKLLPTTTVDEFIEQAKAMKGVAKDFGLSYGYLGDAAQAWRLFWIYYTQLGGTMTLSGRKLHFDEELFVDAVAAIAKILASGVANQTADGSFAFSTFTAGKSGEFFTGVWDSVAIKDAGVPVDADPVPNIFDNGRNSAWGDSHSFILPHQSHLDEERREACYEAVALILKNSLTWAAGGHTPAYQPVVDSKKFKELLPNAHYAETADYLAYDPPFSFAGSGSNWQGDFCQAVQPAYMGTASVKDALKQFTSMTNAYTKHAI